MTFHHLGLNPKLLHAIEKAGYTEATPVQEATIPSALNNRDLIVSAQTGSGKTAAFILPTLEKLSTTKQKKIHTLVLTPTRELAFQITKVAKLLGKNNPQLNIATIVGGTPYKEQYRALSKRVDILIATPGRLIDHLNNKKIDLSAVETLVLDEADRMLDMGFIDDIKDIIAQCSKQRQTLLFSATLSKKIARLAENILQDPERIDISNQNTQHENIEHSIFYADNYGHKIKLLEYLLTHHSVYQAIIFTATKKGAEEIAAHLSSNKFKAQALHGDIPQRKRNRTLTQLHQGKLQFLVATDVAARGIDIANLSHVFNFDLPYHPEDYVHRIGRTGRAGKQGTAYSLSLVSEHNHVKKIERFIEQEIKTEEIDDLKPSKTVEDFKNTQRRKAKNKSRRIKKTVKRIIKESQSSSKKKFVAKDTAKKRTPKVAQTA